MQGFSGSYHAISLHYKVRERRVVTWNVQNLCQSGKTANVVKRNETTQHCDTGK